MEGWWREARREEALQNTRQRQLVLTYPTLFAMCARSIITRHQATSRLWSHARTPSPTRACEGEGRVCAGGGAGAPGCCGAEGSWELQAGAEGGGQHVNSAWLLSRISMALSGQHGAAGAPALAQLSWAADVTVGGSGEVNNQPDGPRKVCAAKKNSTTT